MDKSNLKILSANNLNDAAAKIAKNALKNNTTLKHETLKTGLISEKNYKKIVNPRKLIYPE